MMMSLATTGAPTTAAAAAGGGGAGGGSSAELVTAEFCSLLSSATASPCRLSTTRERVGEEEEEEDAVTAAAGKHGLAGRGGHGLPPRPGRQSAAGSGSGSGSDAMTASTMAVPVAAMRALITLIRRSTASTWMELEGELRSAIDALLHIDSAESGVVSSRTRIPLTSGCELFMRYVTRAFLEFPDFDSCKKEVLRRGETFALMSHTSRLKIAELGHSFVQDGTVVLTHGSSRVVTNLLLKASRTKQFSVIVTEGRPDYEGYHVVRILSEAGVPVKLIIDAAVGAMMDKVDLCIVGAEGVMENGGIVNKVGTMQLAVMAKALGKPFYVAAESYKFSRLYPLDQQDLETIAPAQEVEPDLDAAVATGLDNSLAGAAAAAIDTTQPSVDFTPADLITLLFTDLGVLTPAAVSDELIKLYQ